MVARFLKERIAPDPETYIGKGAVEQIGAAGKAERAKLIVFDDELSPGQVRNLEKAWGEGVRVLDRPGLILDVFALHARTREARTQVELAQLQYLLPRLAGGYGHLSGLGGGIGGRGAGEQKLELDRRKIRDRIARLRKDLAKIEVARLVRRRGRRRHAQVAIAGYTNAGKTTLFNRLTRDSAYAADRLFATLDARAARARQLPDGRSRSSSTRSGSSASCPRRSSRRSARRCPRSGRPTSCSTCSTRPRTARTKRSASRSRPSRSSACRPSGSSRSGTRPTRRASAGVRRPRGLGPDRGGDRQARGGDPAPAFTRVGAVPGADSLHERPGHRGRAGRLPGGGGRGPRRLALDAAGGRSEEPRAPRAVPADLGPARGLQAPKTRGEPADSPLSRQCRNSHADTLIGFFHNQMPYQPDVLAESFGIARFLPPRPARRRQRRSAIHFGSDNICRAPGGRLPVEFAAIRKGRKREARSHRRRRWIPRARRARGGLRLEGAQARPRRRERDAGPRSADPGHDADRGAAHARAAWCSSSTPPRRRPLPRSSRLSPVRRGARSRP